MDNKGLMSMRLLAALLALFTITIVFVFFDPVVDEKLHDEFYDRADSDRARTGLDKYLNSWHLWVPAFVAAIFIYMLTAGREYDYPSKYNV